MILKKQTGFTLIDLVIAMSIVSVLMGIGIPTFDLLLKKSKITSETLSLRGSLQLARKIAITENKKVTICPTLDSIECTRDWSDGYMVFVDVNQDRLFNGQDRLIQQVKIKDQRVSLRWKAFGVQNSMQWHHTGITNHQNGTFQFCFEEEPELSRALIITKAGRIRISRDENGDGIHENAVGKNLKC